MGQEGRTARRHDIDFIRVVVFSLVIIYHASLIFGTRGWILVADFPSRVFDLIGLVSHPWRISLLFFISGISTAALARRLSPPDIRGMRSRQFIPPLLFGLFVLVPPQMYLKAKASLDLQMSYLDFWKIYLRFGAIADRNGAPHSLFGLEHLWFLAYLWLYTVVLTLCLAHGGGRVAGLSVRLSRFLRGQGLLVWPIAYLAVLRLVAFPIFGETINVANDWYTHLVCFSFFVLGFLMADNEAFWAAVVENRGRAMVAAGVSLALMTGLFLAFPPGDRSLGAVILYRLLRSVFQWSAIVAILGVCRVTITASHPVVTYFNRAMLSYYVLHQTVLLLIAYWLKQAYGLGNGSFLVIVLGTAVVCMLVYEVQRRTFQLVKGCFGKRPAGGGQPSTS